MKTPEIGNHQPVCFWMKTNEVNVLPRTPKAARKIISAIRSNDTKTEMVLRRALQKRGLRFCVIYKLLFNNKREDKRTNGSKKNKN